MAAEVNTINQPSGTKTAGIVLIAVGAAFLLAQVIPGFGQVIWAATFFTAAAFLYNVYSKDERKWGWQLLAYGLGMVGLVNVLDMLAFDRLIAVAILGGFAVPFLYAYGKNTNQWGWLIPATLFLIPASIVMLNIVWSWIPVLLIIGGAVLLLNARQGDEAPQPKYLAAINSDKPTQADTPVKEMRPINIEKPQV
jgi:hypothetical protein